MATQEEFFRELIKTQRLLVEAVDEVKHSVDALRVELEGVKVFLRTVERGVMHDHRRLGELEQHMQNSTPKPAV